MKFKEQNIFLFNKSFNSSTIIGAINPPNLENAELYPNPFARITVG